MSRPAGSKNKLTIDVKRKLNKLVDNNFDKAKRELATLEGKQFLDIYIKMIEYLVPKPKEEEINTLDAQPPIIVINEFKP